jgi:hypothetical protein
MNPNPPETERLHFLGVRLAGEKPFAFQPRQLIIAGWTGRDTEGMEQHIRELERIGVRRPRTTPMYYRVAASLLTQSESIEVAGSDSSGEAEVVLLHQEDGLWIAVGSDHTDRQLETIGVTMSKQVCAKPVARQCWHLDDVSEHLDSIVLRSYIITNGERQFYQEGTLQNLRSPQSLLDQFLNCGGEFPVGGAMFCGTVPVRGSFRFSERFAVELVDPVLRRSLTHSYAVKALEIAD